MSDADPKTPGEIKDDLVREYKALLQKYLATRPSGFRKRISEAIGSNRSFVSQITNPNYRVPVPAHNVHKIMDVCRFTPFERATFLEAYLNAHPGQAELLSSSEMLSGESVTFDLSEVRDESDRQLIMQALHNLAETMIALSKSKPKA